MRPLLSVLILCLATCTVAQPMIGAQKRTSMIMMPDMAKELKITKPQQKQFQTYFADLQKNPNITAAMSFGMSFFDPSGELPEGMATVLDDAQKVRLDELFVQYNGGLALLDTKIAKTIGLTDEQNA